MPFWNALLCTVGLFVGQTPEELVQQLKSPEARQRRVAAEKLGRQKHEPAIPALAELLKDKDEDVRRTAVQTLGKIGAKSGPTLATALKLSDPVVRQEAVFAMADMGPKV